MVTVLPQKFHFTEKMVWGLGGGTAEDSRTQQAASGGGVWIAETLRVRLSFNSPLISATAALPGPAAPAPAQPPSLPGEHLSSLRPITHHGQPPRKSGSGRACLRIPHKRGTQNEDLDGESVVPTPPSRGEDPWDSGSPGTLGKPLPVPIPVPRGHLSLVTTFYMAWNPG